MKYLIASILFLGFLLIRSGNSHEVLSHNNRPSISFMEKGNSNGIHHSSSPIILDQDGEDFQLWKDYHLQMAFFAGLICFCFLRVLPENLRLEIPGKFEIYNTQPIFISQRSLRI